MTVKEFKELINRIPNSFDECVILLPEGIHSSTNINWYIDQIEGQDASVIIQCD